MFCSRSKTVCRSAACGSLCKQSVFDGNVEAGHIIGHMESTKRMVEDGRDCSEVLIQLSAIESAIKSVSRVILKEHMSTCIIDAVKHDDLNTIEELNKAIDKFIR